MLTANHLLNCNFSLHSETSPSTKELLKRLSTSTPRRSSLPHLKILDAERLQLAKERTASTGNGNGHVIVERKLEPSNSEDSFWGSDLEEEEELLVSFTFTFTPSLTKLNAVKGCVSQVLVHATFIHVYLDIRVLILVEKIIPF